MLQAIKNGTLTDLQVRTLNIREKELNYWSMTFGTMATQSALIAGFSYGGLTIDIADTINPFLSFGYLTTTTLAMGFGLLAITIATFCTMFGPGLALRGPEGPMSMHKAIEVLQKESKTTFAFFMLSLFCFHISSFLLVWIYYPGFIAVVVNVVLLCFLVMFVTNGMEILKKLYVPDIEAVTGQFSDFSAYEKMPDLEKISRQQEVQMQSQKLVEAKKEPIVNSKGELNTFAMFDFGVLNAIKNVFKK